MSMAEDEAALRLGTTSSKSSKSQLAYDPLAAEGRRERGCGARDEVPLEVDPGAPAADAAAAAAFR